MGLVGDAHALADAIRSNGRLVLLAGEALAAEAGVPAPPAALDWRAYGPRMRAIHATEPGPGHVAARRLQDLALLDAVVTASDDVLFDEAGVRDVVALVGSVELSICPDCGYNEPLGCLIDLLPVPRCAACGGTLRPDVSEQPRAEALARARAAVEDAGLVVLADAVDASAPLRALSAAVTDATVVVLGAERPGATLLAAVGQLGS